MLKKRIIFTLLYDNGTFVLSRNFRLQKVGNLRWLKENYDFSRVAFSIDELIILDVSRGVRDEKKFCEHVRSLSEESFIPVAAGGGIRNVEQAQKLLYSGAEKIVVNSLLAKDKDTITKIASKFGQQCLVASVDAKKTEGEFRCFVESGSNMLNASLSEYLEDIMTLPIGELYLNSMDRDGTGQGYDYDLLNSLPIPMNIPIILAGGAGKDTHLFEGLNDFRVDAVGTAHLFNFLGDGLINARNALYKTGMSLAKWDIQTAINLKDCLLNLDNNKAN
jgi:imidazole glycerol-phosphate synthase subunit HisF